MSIKTRLVLFALLKRSKPLRFKTLSGPTKMPCGCFRRLLTWPSNQIAGDNSRYKRGVLTGKWDKKVNSTSIGNRHKLNRISKHVFRDTVTSLLCV